MTDWLVFVTVNLWVLLGIAQPDANKPPGSEWQSLRPRISGLADVPWNELPKRGDVRWDGHRLRFAGDSHCQRDLEAGYWLELELDLELGPEIQNNPQPGAGEAAQAATSNPSEFLVWFANAGWDAGVVWSRDGVEADVVVRLVALQERDQTPADKPQPYNVLREARFPNLPPRARWKVVYRAGLLAVHPLRTGADRAARSETALPHSALPDEALRNESIPHEALPDEGLPDEALPGEALPGYVDNDLSVVEAIGLEHRRGGSAVLHGLRGSSNHLRPAIEVTPEQAARLVPARELDDQAQSLLSDGRPDEALPVAEKAVQAVRNVLGEESVAYATVVNNLAHVCRGVGDFQRAEALYRRSLETVERLCGGGHPETTDTLSNLAMLLQESGRLAEAEKLLRGSIAIDRKVLGNWHPMLGISLNNLAEVYRHLGDYASAKRLYTESLAIDLRVFGEDHPYCAVDLNNMALLHESLGDYRQAEQLMRRSLELTKRHFGQEHPEYARCQNNLASILESQGEIAQAEALHLEALETRRKTLGPDHPSVADSLNNLGQLYNGVGRHEESLGLLQAALEIHEKTPGGSRIQYAALHANIANLAVDLGQLATAEAHYRNALQAWREGVGEQSIQLAAGCNNLGNLFLHLHDYARAASLFRQADAIWTERLGARHPQRATALHNLALVYFAGGEFTEALKLAGEADAILLTAAQRVVPGLSAAEASSWLAEYAPDPGRQLQIGQAGQLLSAEEAYLRAGQVKGLADRLQASRYVLNGTAGELALQVRQARWRLAELVMAAPPAGEVEAYERAILEAVQTKEALERELGAASAATPTFTWDDRSLAELGGRLPARAAVVDFVALPVREETAEPLADNEVPPGMQVTQWWRARTEYHYHAFVLRLDPPSGTPRVAWVPLGPVAAVDQAIQLWRGQLTAERQPATAGPLPAAPDKLLRARLWDPLEKHLAGIDQVIVIPDGSLAMVPWAALPGRLPNTFLIHDYAVSTLAFVQQLAQQWVPRSAQRPNDDPEPAIETGGLLLIGAVDYGELPAASAGHSIRSENSWGPLPSTQGEIESIAKLYRGRFGQGQLQLLHEEAQEARVVTALESTRYAHLATHGFFHAFAGADSPLEKRLYGTGLVRHATLGGRHPMLRAGLVLAGANRSASGFGDNSTGDGLLTAEEVAALDLSGLRLVVLSACETNRGEMRNGAGVFSLQRAFQTAGARDVMASLWRVDDVATQILMTEFYRHLWQEHQSPVQALRSAQLTMLSRYVPASGQLRGPGQANVPRQAGPATPSVSPFYWAGFQLSGGW